MKTRQEIYSKEDLHHALKAFLNATCDTLEEDTVLYDLQLEEIFKVNREWWIKERKLEMIESLIEGSKSEKNSLERIMEMDFLDICKYYDYVEIKDQEVKVIDTIGSGNPIPLHNALFDISVSIQSGIYSDREIDLLNQLLNANNFGTIISIPERKF